MLGIGLDDQVPALVVVKGKLGQPDDDVPVSLVSLSCSRPMAVDSSEPVVNGWLTISMSHARRRPAVQVGERLGDSVGAAGSATSPMRIGFIQGVIPTGGRGYTQR